MCGGFSHQAILGHQLDVLQSQFTSDIRSAGSIRPHMLRAYLRCQLQVQAVTCASDQMAINWRFPRPPSLGLINLLEQFFARELRHRVYLLDHQLIVEEQPGGSDARDKARGNAHGAAPLSPGMLPSPHHQHLRLFTNLGALRAPSFRGFVAASVRRRGWFDHWPLVIGLSLQPLSPERLRVELKLQSL